MAIILNEACKRGRFDPVAATLPLPQSQWHRCGEFRVETALGLAASGRHRAMPSVAARETAGHLATSGGSRSAASLVAGRRPAHPVMPEDSFHLRLDSPPSCTMPRMRQELIFIAGTRNGIMGLSYRHYEKHCFTERTRALAAASASLDFLRGRAVG